MRENAEKMRTRITPNTDTFYWVLSFKAKWLFFTEIVVLYIEKDYEKGHGKDFQTDHEGWI